jgi:hypothetical protein
MNDSKGDPVIRVFASVNTLTKEMGEIVAVTGDGVNDAPALKTAHLRASMGQSGTGTQKLISLEPLSWPTWAVMVPIAATAIGVNEIHKLICRRRGTG